MSFAMLQMAGPGARAGAIRARQLLAPMSPQAHASTTQEQCTPHGAARQGKGSKLPPKRQGRLPRQASGGHRERGRHVLVPSAGTQGHPAPAEAAGLAPMAGIGRASGRHPTGQARASGSRRSGRAGSHGRHLAVSILLYRKQMTRGQNTSDWGPLAPLKQPCLFSLAAPRG